MWRSYGARALRGSVTQRIGVASSCHQSIVSIELLTAFGKLEERSLESAEAEVNGSSE